MSTSKNIILGSKTAACRTELKYVIGEEKYRALRKDIHAFVEPDLFACSQVATLYLDTSNNTLIRRSLEKPCYKEKLRIRTYGGGQSLKDSCFIEIKKKVNGIVYKRRVEVTLEEAFALCGKESFPYATFMSLNDEGQKKLEQVIREISWILVHYKPLAPTFNISCSRLALKERGTDSLRITFDRDIQWSYGLGSYIPCEGEHPLTKEGVRIMEVKASRAMPLWLVRIFDDLEIYPQSFSKVGNAYKAWVDGVDENRTIIA